MEKNQDALCEVNTPTQRQICNVCNQLQTTLLNKNSNYGNSAFTYPMFAPNVSPLEALLVRLSDKVARLQTLLRGEPDKVGESTQDTLLDIAGYCVLILSEMNRPKEF